MGMYDSFATKDGSEEAQLKCLGSNLDYYLVGHDVLVEKHGFPKTATFCYWGGESQLFYDTNLIGETQNMGVFVIIKDGKLLDVTTDESKILYPVYTKYGRLLTTEILEVDKKNCVARAKEGWYFWNEAELWEAGPCPTKQKAIEQCHEYAKHL